jgi:hypothetical protein
LSERDFGDGDFGEGTMGGPLTTTGGQPPASAKITRWQPILPEEQPPTKAERYFISQTPRIFPANQDSNWGQHRKVFTDAVQLLIDQQSLIWKERFVFRADTFLDEWEFQAGIPENPPGLSVGQRRLKILNRLRSGPFTDQRRIEIIEPYILATFGVSVELGPGGVSLTGGIPLMADAGGDPRQYYRIYEDVRNFGYTVWIASALTPDIVGMLRDLKRITPAGIAANMTVDNSHAQILDYMRTVRNDQPAGWWRLTAADGADSSGNSLGGTWNGSPATVASPGLLHGSVGSVDGAVTLDGVNDYMIVASDPRLHPNRLSLEIWYKPNALPGTGAQHIILAESANDFIGIDGSSGKFIAAASVGGTRSTVPGPLAVVGTTYHLATRFTGSEIQLIVNSVVYSAPAGGVRDIGNTSIYVGRAQGGGSFAQGVVDEPAVYQENLTDAQISSHWKTGHNVLL